MVRDDTVVERESCVSELFEVLPHRDVARKEVHEESALHVCSIQNSELRLADQLLHAIMGIFINCLLK